MRYLGLEFYKLKRRYVFLTALVLFLAETVICDYSIHNSITRHGVTAMPWEGLLMQITALNGLFCPVILAVVSSRICDAEHKGDTWKLLECCSERMSSLYRAKFLCTMILVAAAQAVQFAICIVFGVSEKFPLPLPANEFLTAYFGTLLVDVGVLAVQQFLSMAYRNQFVALIGGLVGAFIGFAGSLFPNEIRRLFIWGYYIELSPAVTAEISKGNYGLAPVTVNLPLIGGVFVFGLLLFFLGRRYLMQKEM